MPDPAEPATGDTSPDSTRSGDDVADAIRVAERGTSVAAGHDRGPEDTTGDAPVEQVRGDPAMTEGQVVRGEGEPGRHRSVGLDPEAGSSGAAQSHPGGRVSDRVAAGEEPPDDPSVG